MAFADNVPVPSYGPAPLPVYAPVEPAYPDVSKLSVHNNISHIKSFEFLKAKKYKLN